MIEYVGKKRDFSRFLRIKIVATIVPSSADEKILLQIIKSSTSVARLNFSHGNYDDHFQAYPR